MNIDAHTLLFGLIGHPVAQSLGPAMHNAAFRALNLNAVYLAFDTVDPAGSLAGMRAMNMRGLSITMPHKSAILPLLDRVDSKAARIGAVNTVVNDGGRLVGLNTDAPGLLEAIRDREEPRGVDVLVAGAGGAARAAAFALAEAGARVTITNRTARRGEALARELDCAFVPLSEAARCGARILVQATSVGMEGGPPGLPLPLDALCPGMVVVETVYRPLQTPFLREARARGCRIIEGREMFVRQGARQVRIWTGLEPPMDVMRKAVEARMKTETR